MTSDYRPLIHAGEAGFPCTSLPIVSHLGSLFRVRRLVLLCPPWKMNPPFPKDQNLRDFLTGFISAFHHPFITMPTSPAKFCHLLGRLIQDDRYEEDKCPLSLDVSVLLSSTPSRNRGVSISDSGKKSFPLLVWLPETS